MPEIENLSKAINHVLEEWPLGSSAFKQVHIPLQESSGAVGVPFVFTQKELVPADLNGFCGQLEDAFRREQGVPVSVSISGGDIVIQR